jgi:hypothetical protein
MEEAVIGLRIDSAGATKTLASLREDSKLLNDQLEGASLGSKAYKELNSQLTQTNKEIKNLELGFEALDNEQQASELGSVAGAVGDITTAFILLGGESDTMQQIAANIEKAIGVSMAFKGAIEGVSSARKLMNSLDKQSTLIKIKDAVVTKTVTAAQWLWSEALTANPIGLIIAGVGALIAAVVAFRKPIIEFISNWENLKVVLLALLGPIGWIIIAYQKLFGEEAQMEKAREKQSRANKQRHKERVAQIRAQRDEFIDAKDAEIKEINHQIERLEAEGKSTDELKLKILKNERDKVKAVIDGNRKILESKLELFQAEAALRGLSDEAFAKSMGFNFQETVDGYTKQLEEQGKVLESAEWAIQKFERERKEKAASASKEAADKQAAIDKKAIDDAKATADKIAEDAKAIQDQLIIDKNKSILELEKLESDYFDTFLTKQQLEENAVRDKYFTLIEEAKKFGQDTAIVEMAREQELLNIQAEYAQLALEQKAEADDKAKEKADELRQEEIESIRKHAEETIQAATDVISIIESISTIANGKEIQRLKDKQAAGEKLSKKEEKKLKRDVAMQKAFAVAKIAVDTAMSLTSAIAGATASAAATGPGAVVATPIFIATQIATVLGAVGSAMAILKKPTPSISQPSASDPTGGTDSKDLAPDAPNTDMFNTGQTLLNQAPQKVYVLESDITDTQATIAAIKQQATVGVLLMLIGIGSCMF